jgi:transglutaminase-like putative cysteine protease
MARTLLATVVPAVAISVSWARLERPPVGRDVVVVAVLALAPWLLPWLWLRIAALAAATAGVALLAFDVEAWELAPGRDERVVAPIAEAVERGIGDYYGVLLPFDAGRHPEMHMLLLLAVFGFTTAVAAFVAARRPVVAAALTIAAVGWPATLLGREAVAAGALALAAALSIFLVLRAQSARSVVVGAAAAALVVAGAAWASSATTFARESVVDWERWDFRGLPAKALGVRFVWDANYDGIAFPPTKTVVLEIEGPDRPQYWRASTLDKFTADRWIEELAPFVVGDGRDDVPLDALTPAAAARRDRWLEQRVEVKALVDDRLVAAGTPTAVDARSLGAVYYLSGGVMRSRRTLSGGTRYRVWSYVPNPSPATLEAAPARYPAAVGRFLGVWGQDLPAFGTPGREDRVRALLADPRYPAFGSYAPLYDEALRLAGDAETPYSAVLALESWFRQAGDFRYEERPPAAFDLPPLVHFVTVTKAGYCQHYAGAMAVMLRLLGIPARVAVGFTSGTHVDGVWRVTDHNAHAWVEVWFPRQGWVAFDPTPGRGRFAGIYSFASESAAAVARLGRGNLDSGRGLDGGPSRGTIEVGSPSRRGERPSVAVLALVLAGGWAAAIGLGKAGLRRLRYLTRDPRRVAAASRRELESFLRDQGVPVHARWTLQDLRRAAAEELGVDGAAFAEAAGRGRFGTPREAARSARRARREVQMLLRRARRELSFWARLRGFVSLRSLRGWQG